MPRNLCSVFVAITLLVYCSSISVLWFIVGRDRVAHETFEIFMRLNSQNGSEFGQRQNIFLPLDSLERSKPPSPFRITSLCMWLILEDRNQVLQRQKKPISTCYMSGAVNKVMKLVPSLFSWFFFSLFVWTRFFALFQQCEVMLQKAVSVFGLNLDFFFSETFISIGFEVFSGPKHLCPSAALKRVSKFTPH